MKKKMIWGAVRGEVDVVAAQVQDQERPERSRATASQIRPG